MRRFLAIIVCKLASFVGHILGRGSSLPGKIALKICPDVLGRMAYPGAIIAVTGSNGKTSTVEMIAAILKADGRRVAYNREGSNQIQGVATTVLTNATLGGRVKADVLLLESDERYAVHSFKYFHPTHLVITDLYRDQLTRNGHQEWIYDCIEPAIHPDTTLILNADDPLSSCFAVGREKVKWFGMDRCSLSSETPSGVYHDGAYCPICKQKMEYRWYHFNQIGDYCCKNCGHRRPHPDFDVSAVDSATGIITINETIDIKLAFFSIYNIYNCAAAFAACSLAGAPDKTIAGVISNFTLKSGRQINFRLGERRGTLLISKHENSIGYDTNLRYIRDSGGECSVMIIVDAISRKYFTSETSWLWDIDFELLNSPNVKKIYLCGRYVNDLKVRFSYTSVPAEKLVCFEKVKAAAESLKSQPGEDIFVITCFSDCGKILSEVVKEG